MNKDPHYTKICRTPEEYSRELFVYRRGLPFIPGLIESQPPLTLVLERVDARPYLDHPGGFDPELLAETLAAFHLEFHKDDLSLCHHDNQPGNILYNGTTYYLIDFSDSIYCSPLHDLSHLMLFWAEEFEPAHFSSLVIALMNRYLEINPVPTGDWQIYLKNNMERFDDRRRRYARQARKNPLRAEVNRDFLKSI